MTPSHPEQLYYSTTSPYARKARIAAAEKQVLFTPVLDVPWNADTKIIAINPLGKVPVWVMADGTALFDSRVIVEYIDTLSPVGKLIPSMGRERAEVKTWEALADGVLDAAILARLEATWAGRSAEQRSQAWIDRQMGKITTSLKAISQGLGEKAYCAGVHFSLADIAVGCVLGYLDFRFPQISWRADYPNLAKLYDKLVLRQSFIDTKPV